MNKFTYENNGINTYLVYEVAEGEKVDSMGLGMITNNKIPGLAQTIFTQKDNNKYIKYNVSSKVDLQSFFSGPVNKKRLLGVFKGIVDAFLSAEEYMLDNSSLILDVEYIFVDVSTCEVSMISLPVLGEPRDSSEICLFFRDMIYALQTDVTEDCSHVAKIINYLNATANFSLVEFKKELINLEGKKSSSAVSLVKPIAQIPSAVQVAAPQQMTVGTTNSPKPAVPTQPQVTPAPAPAPVSAPAPAKQNVQIPQNPAPAKNVQPPKAPPVAPNGMMIPSKGPNGMAVPAKNAPGANNNAAATAAADGQSISLMYLLQHYNSDNAAAYKAQKEAKKAAKASAKPAPAQQAAPPAAADKKKKKEKAPKAPAAPVAPGVPPMAPIPAAPVAPVAQVPVTPPVQAPGVQTSAGYQPASNAQNFGETTVLGGGTHAGETTVLSQLTDATVVQTYSPSLVRKKNNEVIKITKYPFRIGKEKSFVDYFIGDNTAISRSHAEISLREGEYYIKDTNSTNHTFINGDMIQSGVEVKISIGDRLRFANEEFEFQMR